MSNDLADRIRAALDRTRLRRGDDYDELRDLLREALACVEDAERAKTTLRRILPMAKAWAHAHPVGINQELCDDATAYLEYTNDPK